jgi:hypothetical protein
MFRKKTPSIVMLILQIVMMLFLLQVDSCAQNFELTVVLVKIKTTLKITSIHKVLLISDLALFLKVGIIIVTISNGNGG